MLKKLTIRNFKAIQEMTIEFTPLTVLIGENSCGKTTVLQALDFLGSIVYREIPDYFNGKGWSLEELKSQLNDGQNKPIEFISVYEFSIENVAEVLSWSIRIDHDNIHWIIDERIVNLTTKEVLYPKEKTIKGPMMAGQSGAYAGGENAYAQDNHEIFLQASFLKYYTWVENNPLLAALKKFLSYSTFFGVVSPDKIRLGKNPGTVGNIGIGGEWLSAFIHHLDEGEKKDLEKAVSDFFDIKMRMVTSESGPSISLYVYEKHSEEELVIDAWHSSDGFLKIIALSAIVFQRLILRHGNSDAGIRIKYGGTFTYKGYTECNAGLILLDEIENGINPYLTQKAIDMLRKIQTVTKRQIIVTTHSPVILNDFDHKEIIFMWKEKNGAVHSRKLFNTEEMNDTLEFLNPGEVWLNYSKDELIEKMNGNKVEKD